MPQILYIEDSRAFQRLMAKYLPEDCKLTVADSLAAGWELFQTRAFDLLICDYLFPEGDTFDLIFKIRRLRSPDDLPIVMFTGAPDRYLINRFHRSGINATVAKPPDVPRFRELIAGMLAKPWIEAPDIACSEAALFTWSTSEECCVFCPNLHIEVRAATAEQALKVMGAKIEEHLRAGRPIPVITVPRQTAIFPREAAPS